MFGKAASIAFPAAAMSLRSSIEFPGGRSGAAPDPNNNPQNVTATYLGPLIPQGLTVNWDQPVNGPPEAYDLYADFGSGYILILMAATSPVNVESGAYPGSNGTSVTFRVVARYFGDVQGSATVGSLMPPGTAATPETPTTTTTTIDYTVSIVAGGTGVYVRAFLVDPADPNDGSQVAQSTGTSGELTGLTPDTTYYVTATEFNATGQGRGSSATSIGTQP
jgi:hypothetical protein